METEIFKCFWDGETVSELAAPATATTVAKGVAKGVLLYFKAWWRGDPAVAVAVAIAANPDTARTVV